MLVRGVLGFVLSCLAVGCQRAPKNLSPPPLDPTAAAKQAVELFDTDKDGIINSAELDSSPGLKAAVRTTDSDGDGGLSETEIRDRLELYVESKTAIRNFQIGLERGGVGLRDLDVVVVPEPFLADYVEPARGITNIAGVVAPGIDFTDPDIAAQGYSGLRLGMYRVEVTQPDPAKKQIPAKYNEDTVLGVEVGLDHHSPLPVLKLSY